MPTYFDWSYQLIYLNIPIHLVMDISQHTYELKNQADTC